MFDGILGIRGSNFTKEEHDAAVKVLGEEAVKVLEDNGFSVGGRPMNDEEENKAGWIKVSADCVKFKGDGIVRFSTLCGSGEDFVNAVNQEFEQSQHDDYDMYEDDYSVQMQYYNKVLAELKRVVDKVDTEKLPPAFYVGYDTPDEVKAEFVKRYGEELTQWLGENGVTPIYLWCTSPVEDYTKVTLECNFGEGAEHFTLHLPIEDSGNADRSRGDSFKKAFTHAMTALEINDFQYLGWNYLPDQKYFWTADDYSSTPVASFKLAHEKMTEMREKMTPIIQKFDSENAKKTEKTDKDDVER